MQQSSTELGRSCTKLEDGCRVVPCPSLNAYEDNMIDNTCSIWEEKEYLTLNSTISCSRIKSESYSSEVPNITGQMSGIHLLDNTCGAVHDLHVNFMDLKRFYLTKDLEIENQEKTMVFLRAKSKIVEVKVYIKKWQAESPTSSVGPIELKSNFDHLTGWLTVYLNISSFPQTWLEDVDDTKWQLYVVTLFEDGKSQCCYSSAFQLQESSFVGNDCQDSQRSCYQIDGYQINESGSDRGLSSPARSRMSSESDASIAIDEQPSDEPNISLLPESELNIDRVRYELCQESDTVLIQEQQEFAGLLKLVKRKVHRDPMGRRRANGFRSAEEAFQWVCGHCFFRRMKKSTVRAHVLRKVCHRNRRIYAENNLRKPFRRANTFPGCRESFSYDDEMRSQTP